MPKYTVKQQQEEPRASPKKKHLGTRRFAELMFEKFSCFVSHKVKMWIKINEIRQIIHRGSFMYLSGDAEEEGWLGGRRFLEE